MHFKRSWQSVVFAVPAAGPLTAVVPSRLGIATELGLVTSVGHPVPTKQISYAAISWAYWSVLLVISPRRMTALRLLTGGASVVHDAAAGRAAPGRAARTRRAPASLPPVATTVPPLPPPVAGRASTTGVDLTSVPQRNHRPRTSVDRRKNIVRVVGARRSNHRHPPRNPARSVLSKKRRRRAHSGRGVSTIRDQSKSPISNFCVRFSKSRDTEVTPCFHNRHTCLPGIFL